jgi:hypothetical protein
MLEDPFAPLEVPAAGGAMDDSELANLLGEHENRAVGYYTSEIADEQAKAIDYYYGRPFGDEREGRSSVVDRTVAITIDSSLAALVKPFVSADEVVSFEPRGEEDVEQAEQATEYVNYVFQCDNQGFLILHDWFKDALLTKIGVVKAWWEDRTTETVEPVMVDALGLMQARESEDYQGEEDNGDGTFTVQMRKVVPDGRVKVENVPPEEFLISPFARSIDEAPYTAHRPSNYTRSMLIEMGMDAEVVADLPEYASGRNEESRSIARYRDEEWASTQRDFAGSDKAQDIVGVLDEYIRVDYDGDGIAELRRVIRVQDTILLNEPVAENPFSLLCPVPMPHKVYGLSLADQTMDLQRIASVVWRQTLDNLYLSNNPRPVIPDAAVNDSTLDDLEDPTPGAGIRVKVGGQLDFMTVPFAADKSFSMLQYIEAQSEARTGVSRQGRGFDRDALRKGDIMTATQAAMVEDKNNERTEMIARIFAETGVKRLFKMILRLLVENQPKERMIRLRNKWVPVDPRNWNADMDLSISVGLGVGNKTEQMAQADGILQKMATIGQTPFAYLIDANKVHAALKRAFNAAGVKNVNEYLNDPADDVDPETGQPRERETPPSADVLKAQADGQAQQAKMQMEQQRQEADMMLRQQEAAAKLELVREEATMKRQIEQERAQAEFSLAERKFEFEADLAMRKMQLEADLAREKNAVNFAMTEASISTNRPGGALDE